MRQVLVKLQDDEVAAKINLTTGEIIEMKSDRREYFSKSAIFRKSDSNSWTFLFRELSYEEFLAASPLSLSPTYPPSLINRPYCSFAAL